jgi:hypothetical protein
LERCKTGDGYQFSGARELLGFFASSTGRPVIASHDELESEKFSAEVRGDLMTTEMMWALLRVYSGSGRIVEQRFLRQAYVVVGYPPLGSKIRMRVPIR